MLLKLETAIIENNFSSEVKKLKCWAEGGSLFGNPDEAKRNKRILFFASEKTLKLHLVFFALIYNRLKTENEEAEVSYLRWRGRIFKVASTFRLKVPLRAKCTLVMMLKIDSFKNFFWLLVTLMPKAKEWPSVQKKRTVTARKGNYWERWWWENTVLSNSKESSQYRVLSYLMDFFYKALSSILHALDKNREIHFLKKIHESKKWP